MKKSLKVILIVLISILTVCGIAFAVFASIGKCKEDHVYTTENESWMANIKDDTLLTHLVIPGSHDSCTYTMNYFRECQNLTIDEQLKIGVRYFDLRIKEDDDEYYFYHSETLGVAAEPVLDKIIDFVLTHPTETLILDFQHMEDSFNYIINYMKEGLYDSDPLNNHIITKPKYSTGLDEISKLTLGEARGKVIMFFGDNDKRIEDGKDVWRHELAFLRNDDECTIDDMALNSYYWGFKNALPSKLFISQVHPFYFSKAKERFSEEGRGLFVLQCQMTDRLFIIGPYTRERINDKYMSDHIKDLANNPEYLDLLNIVMRDFVTTEKINDIIELNKAKGYWNN